MSNGNEKKNIPAVVAVQPQVVTVAPAVETQEARGNYQSAAAKQKALDTFAVTSGSGDEVVEGLKGTSSDNTQTVDMSDAVKVRTGSNIPRLRVGPGWYSFKAGQWTIVPRSVAIHLQEKGLLMA